MATKQPARARSKASGGGTGTRKAASSKEEHVLDELLEALRAARDGDFSVRLSERRAGKVGQVSKAFNELVERNAQATRELARVGRLVGREGRMGERFALGDARGGWAEKAASVNGLIADLSRPTTEVARVIESVARGDLAQRMALTIEGQPVKGEFLRIGTAVNGMVDQLGTFADEVTRVAREVGTEGRLGGQAKVKGVSGTWKDLTDNVNSMATALTTQVRDIASVTTAVAKGDLSRKITVEARGEILELKNTLNTMVDQLASFADEVTRVAREVGTEGKLGGQAEVRGVSGTWRELTENVNVMASNLTDQVRGIATVATAVARGDLTRKITVEAKGEVAALAETLNSMTDTLQAFAGEVTRVAREVGTEGVLGGQAQVEGVAGTWKDLTDNVNSMATALTTQVRDIASVTTAVANGDLTQKVTVDVRGELLELKNTVNTMVDQLSSFAAEVTRVAREVGTEGRLGGQAEVEGVSGTWRGLTENVNSMASNLTGQVRNIAQVATAVAKGDLSQKVTVEVRGELLELKETLNTMVDQLSGFADEVTRVAREVGTEGRLGGQAEVEGVSGTWKRLTDNVNGMASNLTDQVRNISQVATAVARGDLSQRITVEAFGEILELKETLNTMVDQLSAFAGEVTRVAREVGTEGRLGGQAEVEGVSGTWRDLTENVNYLASNLTNQVRNIAQVTTAVANGDLTQKITVDARGEIAELKETLNTMVDQLSTFADEVTRVAREVGTEGMLGGQARVAGVSGTWRDLTENVNGMASNLTSQVRNIAQVATAVAKGDLGQKITVDARGEIAELKQTLNTMVDQLSAFADEVTRVAREVGTEGKLGGQAKVRGVSGTWKDLTENVNTMAASLTAQVRDIAQVTTAVANGDLGQKITVDVRGEIAELKKTLNTMVDQLSAFAGEVTRVAREVGTEGKLGGQAEVKGVSGTWKDLTDNVNTMAASLTTQVRAIAEVSSAVTSGDLTRQVTVEAQGEVAELKDTINQMIANLAETTRVNRDQDWLKTNVARISSLMQGQRNLQMVSRLLMSELTPAVEAQHGAFFLADQDTETAADERELKLIASYGYKARNTVANTFKPGEGLVGQSALERSRILLTDAPVDYIKVSSGLGESDPVNVIVLPVLFEDSVLGVIELASLHPFDEIRLSFLDQVVETIGVVLSTIIANMRTEELLDESQRLAGELGERSQELQNQQEELRRSNAELESQAASLKASEELLQQQQEELQQTNEELQEKARLLADQNKSIEVKNREIEMARLGLEEKAQQLAVSSKYKSEFLANMSHELRTPLNSLLILAKLLSDNGVGNLDEQQVEFAKTIHHAGSDLLSLINDILDVSKVEAGKMDVIPAEVRLDGVCTSLDASFRPMTEQKGLDLVVELDEAAPESIVTDQQRLHQVLKNLLSNAVKFTESGSVTLRIGAAPSDMRFGSSALARARRVVSFEVRDTGIGIAPDQLRIVFEAFQQADGTISRRYGGTGLGLTISREITRLLGGEIRVASTKGEGSVFTLYMPDEYHPIATEVTDAPTSTAMTAVDRAAALPPLEMEPLEPMADDVPDDRAAIRQGDRVLLVVEAENVVARHAMQVAHGRDLRVVIASRGGAALALAREFQPDGVLLDTQLPYTDGMTLLAHLKQDVELRHIPVHVLTRSEPRQTVLRAGAMGVHEGPVTGEALEEAIDAILSYAERSSRHLLVVEDDDTERGAIIALLGGDDIDVTGVGSSEEAIAALEAGPVDCIVLDLKLPKMSGFALLEKIKEDEALRNVPVIVYTGKDLTRREETRLSKFAETIIIKDARSPERLLEETTLYLHRAGSRLPDEQRLMLEEMHASSAVLTGKKVLVVDDDVRNVFALTSVLERHGMAVGFAENGRDGIASLQADPDIDIVLMDIMMPKMDGYETMAAIRELPQFRKLPIIALTAKAMKGDRERSIAAGASDYVTKPVDTDQLLSLMRVWLYQ